MAKAHITTPDGVKIEIEGTAQEVSAVVQNLKAGEKRSASRRAKVSRPGRSTLTDLVASLADGGFFKQPKDLASIKSALAELGHHYPITTISPVLLRLVQRRILRRLKQDKRWMYTRGN